MFHNTHMRIANLVQSNSSYSNMNLLKLCATSLYKIPYRQIAITQPKTLFKIGLQLSLN